MSSKKKEYKPDPDGQESISKAIMATANSYPGLDRLIGERFVFCETEPEEGLSLMAASGSFIYEHHESVTGHIWVEGLYPLVVIYRASGLNEKRKMEVKEWIDNFNTEAIEKIIKESILKMVIVNITDDGYIVIYIPESWDDIVFNTTGYDIAIEDRPDIDYGHLVISY